MKYLKLCEGISEHEKTLVKKLVKTITNFIQEIYPEFGVNVESIKTKKYGDDKRYLIELTNVGNVLTNRNSSDLDWLEIERDMFDVTIHFPIRWDEDDFLDTVNIYLMPIIKKFQTNNDHEYIFVIKYKDIQKIIDEISIEEFRLHQETDKYNL